MYDIVKFEGEDFDFYDTGLHNYDEDPRVVVLEADEADPVGADLVLDEVLGL